MGFLGESASHASCFGLPDGGWYVVAGRILWVSMGRTVKGNFYLFKEHRERVGNERPMAGWQHVYPCRYRPHASRLPPDGNGIDGHVVWAPGAAFPHNSRTLGAGR